MVDKNKNLYYLDELSGYKVASDYCDVRGWEVKDAGNRTIGKVDGLLVNKQAERVVYLDVEVDEAVIEEGHKAYAIPASKGVHGFLNEDGDNHLIIPIGMVSLDEEGKKVCSNQIDYSTFTKTSRFRKGSDIDSDYELKVFRHYTTENPAVDEKFYNRKEFDNSLHGKHS